jgi:hypothetical protein
VKNLRVDAVDNGFVVTIEKFDILTKRPDGTVNVFKTLDEVLAHIKKEF